MFFYSPVDSNTMTSRTSMLPGIFLIAFGDQVKVCANSISIEVFVKTFKFWTGEGYVGDVTVQRSALGANMNLVGHKKSPRISDQKGADHHQQQ